MSAPSAEKYQFLYLDNQDLPGEHPLRSEAVAARADGHAHSPQALLRIKEELHLIINLPHQIHHF